MTSKTVRVGQVAVVAAIGFLSCAQSLPDHAKVIRVIDGDTIELADGRLVRYIGIDTPEFRRWARPPGPTPATAGANGGPGRLASASTALT